MLVQTAVADTYGAGFEFDDPSPGRPNDLSFFVRNRAYHKLQPGAYTDDTQMALAVAKCLLEGNLDGRSFAAAFVEAFRRDPRYGYGRRLQAILDAVTDVDDFLVRIIPDSERSGAAMRAAPVGLLPTIAEVLEVAETQARVTHDTAAGVAAAKGAALMAHHQAYGLGSLADLPVFLSEHVPDIAWDDPYRGVTRSAGEQIVRAALAVLLDARSLSDVLRIAVEFGGDTDTVAAIAMGAACLSDELADDLPLSLYANMEQGPFGLSHLREVDEALAGWSGVRKVVDHRIVALLGASAGAKDPAGSA